MTSSWRSKVSAMEVPVSAEQCLPIVESKRLPCDLCGQAMEPEHAHYKCPSCGYILPCCGW